MAHKLFRDPLYDYIQIGKEKSWLLDLIDTPELQRLRYINQLGLSHFTYPGSNHSRFTEVQGLERVRAITGVSSSVLRYYFPKENEREIKKLLK